MRSHGHMSQINSSLVAGRMMAWIVTGASEGGVLPWTGEGFKIPAIQLASQGQQSVVSLRDAASLAALAEPQRSSRGGSPRRATLPSLPKPTPNSKYTLGSRRLASSVV